jgi:hypothetical protein
MAGQRGHGGTAAEKELRELVATAGAVLYRQGLTDYLGHCSARVPGTDYVIIKPKHSKTVRSPAELGPADMIVIVLAAQPDSVIAANPVYACWVSSSSWLNSHKQVAAKFVAALKQADSYMAAHPGYLASILPKYTTVSASLARQVTLPDFTTRITAADVEPWARAAAKYGITRSVVSPSSAITTITP